MNELTSTGLFFIACILESRRCEIQLLLEHDSLTPQQRKTYEESLNRYRELYKKVKKAEYNTACIE